VARLRWRRQAGRVGGHHGDKWNGAAGTAPTAREVQRSPTVSGQDAPRASLLLVPASWCSSAVALLASGAAMSTNTGTRIVDVEAENTGVEEPVDFYVWTGADGSVASKEQLARILAASLDRWESWIEDRDDPEDKPYQAAHILQWCQEFGVSVPAWVLKPLTCPDLCNWLTDYRHSLSDFMRQAIAAAKSLRGVQ
jgi:hypothetical protein